VNRAGVEIAALPPEIARVLRDAFGEEPVLDVSVLDGGRSGATLLSLRVAGVGYVLRRADPTRPAHALRSARELACMKIASEHGVAPKLAYVDVASSISIMERIQAMPFGRSPPARRQRIERVARTLRKLHEGPPFPKGLDVAGMVRHVDEVLRARAREGLPEPLVRTMGELASLTARFAETAPCHNDLNPGNILEAEDAVYFIDWETAGASDPFVDLAELGVFAFPTTEDRGTLLEAYLARDPSDEERARTMIARVMALGFYATAFIHGMAMIRVPPSVDAAALPMAEIVARLGSAAEPPAAEIVAASLLREMRHESETDDCKEAKRVLTRR
jgi:aminoglycoside phosphotransferase (APT) family kinase protein